MNKVDRAVIRNYLSEWGRLIRVDGTMVQYGTSPLAQAMGGSSSAAIEDPVMERVFQFMGRINKEYPQLHRFEWWVYVDRLRIKEVAKREGCSTRYVHQWLAQGEDYLWFYMRGSSEVDFAKHRETKVAVEYLDKYYEEKVANQRKIMEKTVYATWNGPTLSMPSKKSV